MEGELTTQNVTKYQISWNKYIDWQNNIDLWDKFFLHMSKVIIYYEFSKNRLKMFHRLKIIYKVKHIHIFNNLKYLWL